MIIFRIKKCCEKCNTPDLVVDLYPLEVFEGETEKIQEISCSHQRVCKRYLEYVEENGDAMQGIQ